MEYQDLKSGIRNHLNDAAEDFFIAVLRKERAFADLP